MSISINLNSQLRTLNSQLQMKDALLEIGTEHLPARFIPEAMDQLRENAMKLLQENRLSFKKIRSLGTPRRLTLLLEGLQEKSEPQIKSTPGPRASLLKDAQGHFTPQALGFAKSQGVIPEDLKIKNIANKGDVLVVEKEEPGIPTVKLLPEIFTTLIDRFKFPKKMGWEETHYTFARPIRNLVALYGKKTLRIEVAGVKSSNKTQGHPSLSAKPISISEPARYLGTLKNHCILADPEERKAKLLKDLEQTSPKGCHFEKDPGLIEEVTCLTENPIAVRGKIAEKFLKLPPALLTTVLKKQLKFFPVLDSRQQLQPYFIGIRDGISEFQKEVQEGYERVVDARLNDAVFFLDKDSRSTLREMRERLKKVTFHSQLGTLYQKSERIASLSKWILKQLGSEARANPSDVQIISELCYSDLVSEVVKEFPELQGAIGNEYAKRDSLPQKVARGIMDFYKPLSSNAELPLDVEGAIVSVAGKLDSLVGNFLVGNTPTGSEDPFALKRQGVGIVRILIEKNISVDMVAALKETLNSFPHLSETKSLDILMDFLWQRATAYFEEKGYPFDEIEACGFPGLLDLPVTLEKLEALHRIRKRSDFESLALVFKRASNILKQANFSNHNDLKPELFKQEAEKNLYHKLSQVQQAISRLPREAFEEKLKELVALKAPLDHFFEQVMVMVEDTDLKENRLTLLNGLVNLIKQVADLSKLQG
ncbi:MAG: glycine--tRNA ligase subunit beta [Elusimicrobia bacterium]|nr:glycine--tRNA ligase subunit beta [Elusimicrobiota bacterium]